MDKSKTANDRIIEEERDVLVHRASSPMPSFHQTYGLWIIHSQRKFITERNRFEECPVRRFEFYSVSHLLRGAGRLWLPGQPEVDLKPGDVVVITPGTLNRYGGVHGQPYMEDAIQFCGTIADRMADCGILASGVFPVGDAPELDEIIAWSLIPSKDAQIQANIRLQMFLTQMYLRHRERERTDSMAAILRRIHDNLQHWWTVAELAELANLPIERFRARFLEHTGMLPKAYIEECKLRQAASLLTESNATITAIAHTLGYQDPYHFSRRFKLWAGISPEFYRRQF